MASTRPILSDAIRQVIQASSKDGQKGLNKDIAKNAQVIVEGLLNKGIKRNNSNTSKYVRDMRANYAKDLSVKKAVNNGNNTRDKSNVKIITPSRKIVKSKPTIKGSLIKDFNGMNKVPEPKVTKSTFPLNGMFSRSSSGALFGQYINGQYANQGFVPIPLDKYNAALVKLMGSKGSNWSTQGTNVPINEGCTLYLDSDGVPREITEYDENGLPMYLDTKDNTYKYIDVGVEDPQPKSTGDIETPTLDTIFKRINSGRDLARLGIDSIVHNPDTSIDDTYANQSNISNMSTIPTNMSTPILDITPRPSNTNSNTPDTPTIATNATPQRNASRMQPKAITPTVTTPVAPKASVKQSVPVEGVTLGSVINKAPLVRRNGGFDEYRRQSALAALRNAGGISPAEGVQRGIIPYEALQYI